MDFQLKQTIISLWHISRTALAGMQSVPTRYDRMQYIKAELNNRHTDLIEGLSPKKVWFAIEDCITVY